MSIVCTFQVLTPQKSLRNWFGKNIFSRLLHKEFELEKKTVKIQFPGYMWIPDYY